MRLLCIKQTNKQTNKKTPKKFQIMFKWVKNDLATFLASLSQPCNQDNPPGQGHVDVQDQRNTNLF